VFERGDINSQALPASQFGVEIVVVDLEREMMQRGRPAISVRHLEEDNVPEFP
jgi:hypothetical protein